jgi:titin
MASIPNPPTISSFTVGGTSITLFWTPPENNGGSEITGYLIEEILPDSSIQPSGTVAGSITSIQLLGLTTGQSYTYRVVAINSIGNSLPSSPTPSLTCVELIKTVPTSPTNITVTPGPGTAIISWEPPEFNGNTPITGYRVICHPHNKMPNITGAAARTLTISELKNSTEYKFTVVAINEIGESNTFSITPLPIPNTPCVFATRGGSQTIHLSWTTKPIPEIQITGYLVTASPSTNGINIPTPLVTTVGGSVSVSGLTNGVRYVFLVKAISSIGQSIPGLSKPIVVGTSPNAPTSLVGISSMKSIGLMWSAPINTGGLPITGYNILYTQGQITKVVRLSPTTSTLIKNLTNGLVYTCRVQAINSAGLSQMSESISVTPGSAL